MKMVVPMIGRTSAVEGNRFLIHLLLFFLSKSPNGNIQEDLDGALSSSADMTLIFLLPILCD